MAFRRRYNLPPTDARYLSATREEIITDYWAHYYTENKADEVEDDSFDLAAELTAIEAQARADENDPDAWEEVKT